MKRGIVTHMQIHVALRQRGWFKRTCDLSRFGFVHDLPTLFLAGAERAPLNPF